MQLKSAFIRRKSIVFTFGFTLFFLLVPSDFKKILKCDEMPYISVLYSITPIHIFTFIYLYIYNNLHNKKITIK